MNDHGIIKVKVFPILDNSVGPRITVIDLATGHRRTVVWDLKSNRLNE